MFWKDTVIGFVGFCLSTGVFSFVKPPKIVTWVSVGVPVLTVVWAVLFTLPVNAMPWHASFGFIGIVFGIAGGAILRPMLHTHNST